MFRRQPRSAEARANFGAPSSSPRAKRRPEKQARSPRERITQPPHMTKQAERHASATMEPGNTPPHKSRHPGALSGDRLVTLSARQRHAEQTVTTCAAWQSTVDAGVLQQRGHARPSPPQPLVDLVRVRRAALSLVDVRHSHLHLVLGEMPRAESDEEGSARGSVDGTSRVALSLRGLAHTAGSRQRCVGALVQHP